MLKFCIFCRQFSDNKIFQQNKILEEKNSCLLPQHHCTKKYKKKEKQKSTRHYTSQHNVLQCHIVRLRMILLPKMPSFVHQKMQISSKICPKSRILPFFAIQKGLLTTVNLLYAVNLLYKVLPKQFQGFRL